MLNPGVVVAGYRIERVLGTGGMGAVYLAANPTLPRYDALKVLSAELSLDPDFRTRFVREADVASALDHPNIVSVYNRGQTENGELWIAMQFVDGTDADAALRDGTMTPQRAVHVVGEVAKALDYAHARGVVHRDVKPANFMVSGTPGPDERALLGDFGIARALDDVGLTATGSVLATVAYAAPEVLSGMVFDGRADIYSLGCSLFRLLTGHTPFAATNGMAAVMMAHLQQPPPRVSDVMPGLPRALDDVIAAAMTKDPAARFSSAGALAEAAQCALYRPGWTLPGAAFTAPRQRASRSHPTGTGRRRAWLLGAGAAVVLLAGASLTGLMLTHRDSPAQAPDAGADVTAAPGKDAKPRTSQRPVADDVPAAALRSILLTANQIPDNDAEDAVILERDVNTLLDDSATVDVTECVGAWAPAQQRAYDGGDFTGVAAQMLRGMYQQVAENGIIQAVIAFPSPAQAVQSLQKQQKQWTVCAGREITVSPAGAAVQTWRFDQPQMTAGTTRLDIKPRGGEAVCQHGINVRGNVLIDIRQCLPQGGNDVSALVNATANKMPRQ